MRIKTKDDRRQRIQLRQRKRIAGTAERPRLTVFRSVSHIYAQVIDDVKGVTIAAASTLDKDVRGKTSGATAAAAAELSVAQAGLVSAQAMSRAAAIRRQTGLR